MYRASQNVMPDMSLYNLIHQAVDGATGCGDELQDVGALLLRIERL